MQARSPVQAFDIARRGKAHIGTANYGPFLSNYDFWRAIASLRPFAAWRFVCLYNLCEVYVCAESLLYSLYVGTESVTRNLDSVMETGCNITNKRIRRDRISLADLESWN